MGDNNFFFLHIFIHTLEEREISPETERQRQRGRKNEGLCQGNSQNLFHLSTKEMVH